MAKQLSMKEVQKEVNIYNEFVEFPVTVNGTEYEVKLFPFFSPEKVTKMLNEIVEFNKAAQKENFELPENQWEEFVAYYIVRTFTNIKMTKSKKAKVIYQEFKSAINSKLFDVIIQSIPEESVNYVYEKLYQMVELTAKFEGKLAQLQEEYQGLNLENKDIFEQLNQVKKEKQIPEV